MTMPRKGLLPPALVALPLLCWGCGETPPPAPADNAPSKVAGPSPGEPAEATPVPDVTQGPGTSPSIKDVMARLTKGPNSLTPTIEKELESDSPPWETIQSQTREFAQLAAALGKNDPPKGHKESWVKLTAAYAEWASDLDRAAQEKNKDAALEAHGKLAGSCMECHREHREMRKGMGGPPGFGPPPGGRPGGPPPDGGPPRG